MTRQTHALHGMRSVGFASRVMVLAIICGAASMVVVPALTATAVATLQAAQDTQTLREFEKRVDEYLALRKKIEDSLPRFPTKATPQQIDVAQQQLSRGIAKARAGAKVGDVFGPEAQSYLRRVLERAFGSADAKQLRASILDENPVAASVRVNGPYPDSVPLSTMPPKVLEALPKLPEELEFRFVGERLILFDNHAHLIVDYIDRALPRA